MLSFSLVINTLNRGPLLAKTLESLQWLKYDGDFEVIVVNGPSTDNSDQVISSWLPKIRAGKCHVANLSVSRNIGICMSQGDIVAFIDDDAIPEPEWLTQLAIAYDSPIIGGAGGLVFDQSGYTYQYQYSTANRLANANWEAGRSAEHLCFPGSFEFPYLQGTNASFRKSSLLEVGGFDEEIEYYLDETELCCRLIDAGYVIRQLPNAYVHHKFAPSDSRDENRITRHRYPVIKNKIYFSLKHGLSYMPIRDILKDNQNFTSFHENDVNFHIEAGRLDQTERARFLEENERAWLRGMARGLSHSCELITQDKIERWSGKFNIFGSVSHQKPITIVLLSKDYPPGHAGGIAAFSKELAESLSALGHIVHVITQSHDINRVDFDGGVWVHRMLIREIELPPEVCQRNIPQHIWNWSATAFEEARRISSHRHIDVVEAPIWDCEGVAFLLDRQWPLVTSLHTTLDIWLDSHTYKRYDSEWVNTFLVPMLSLESELITNVEGVRANSNAIVSEIEQRYQIQIPALATKVIPHGLAASPKSMKKESCDCLEILFVGRLESRKGIDVFLKALPQVLETVPDARVRIIGDNSLVGPDGVSFMDAFMVEHGKQNWFDKVTFEGRVDQDVLLNAYITCDILVAPSRFESFGLIFLEAMREGKPVIGCKAGGMPEVVSNGVNGLLVEPGDIQLLSDAILQLATNHALRQHMGDAGKRLFEEKFTANRMAEESLALYDLAKANFSGSH